MGFYGANLWDLWGSMFLRSGAYGIYRVLCDCGVGPMGLPWGYGTAVWDLWDCGVGPMGLPWIYGIVVRDLWDAWGSVGLQCGTLGIPMRLRDYGVGLMGHKLWA